jgi:transposase-like protein
LRLAETSGKAISELERDLGLLSGLLRQWQRHYLTSEESTTVQPSAEGEAAAEIRHLKRELAIMRQERDTLKSHHGILTGAAPVKYRFIEAHRAAYPVERLCRVLAVSRSSYYVWCKRRPSARQQQAGLLAPAIQRFLTNA